MSVGSLVALLEMTYQKLDALPILVFVMACVLAVAGMNLADRDTTGKWMSSSRNLILRLPP